MGLMCKRVQVQAKSWEIHLGVRNVCVWEWSGVLYVWVYNWVCVSFPDSMTKHIFVCEFMWERESMLLSELGSGVHHCDSGGLYWFSWSKMATASLCSEDITHYKFQCWANTLQGPNGYLCEGFISFVHHQNGQWGDQEEQPKKFGLFLLVSHLVVVIARESSGNDYYRPMW